MTRCSAANSSMRAVTSIDAAVFPAWGVSHRPTADPVQHADLRDYGRTRIGQSQAAVPARTRNGLDRTSPPGLHGLRLPASAISGRRVRGVSILERLAGLCDGVLQSLQKPVAPLREMTVAGGTASAHDSPISAPAWTDEWPLHAAAGHPHRPRTCVRAHAPPARVRAACGRSISVGCHRPASTPHDPPRVPSCLPLRTHRPASFAHPAPFQPFLPARSARTGKMRAFVARPGCQTVRAQAADRSFDRALQLYRPSYPRYYNPPIAGQ